MDEIQIHEFDALRATIRDRGRARPIVLLGGISAWALTLIVVLVWLPNPLASMVPLLVLASTFEAVRTLHMGVERIGVITALVGGPVFILLLRRDSGRIS